jgi:tetratricopeptide (TPR) repeat protein
MSEIAINKDAELIIGHNKEQWHKLLFFLSNPEGFNVIWIYTDTAFIRKPLHDALMHYLPHLMPYDIIIDEQTVSLNLLIHSKKDIPKEALIHVYGMEDAVKSREFLANLNFNRNRFFREVPANLLIWSDFATSNVLSHTTYDFWSWMSITVDFVTPPELLTARQKDMPLSLILEDKEISVPSKDSEGRIKHLENEWAEFLKSVNGYPKSVKQTNDAVTLSRAFAMEYRESGYYEKAKGILESVVQFNSPFLAGAPKYKLLNDLAVLYNHLGDNGKAKILYEQALQGNINLYGNDNIEVATNKSNLALVLTDLGELNMAKELLTEVLESKLKNKLPDISTVQSNLATIYVDLDDFKKARDLLEPALESDIKSKGESHPNVSIKRSNLGLVYYYLGDFYKAIDLLNTAVSSDINNYSENHPNVGIRYSILAYCFLALNNVEKARSFMEKAYKISLNANGPAHPDTKLAVEFLKQLEQNNPQ